MVNIFRWQICILTTEVIPGDTIMMLCNINKNDNKNNNNILLIILLIIIILILYGKKIKMYYNNICLCRKKKYK
jgi:hypothetical protein